MPPVATLYFLPNSNGTRVSLEFHKTNNSAVPEPTLSSGYAGKFYLRTSIDGKRVWQSYATVKDALLARDQFVAAHDRRQAGLPAVEPTAAVAAILKPAYAKGTISAAVEEFITYSENRIEDWRKGADNGLAPNSFVAYRKAMRDFAASCAQYGATRMDEFHGDRGKAILFHFKTWLGSNVNRRAGKAAHGDARKFIIVDTFLARNGIKLSKDRKFNPNDPGPVSYTHLRAHETG